MLAAVAITPAEAQDTFTAPLGWVPIGGAERNDVAGEGSVTGTLSGSRLSITGSFEGLPAKVTAAKLHQGIAKGARGTGPAIADLQVNGDTRGTVSGDVPLNAEQVNALKAGRLYLQIYSEKGVPPDHVTLWGWLASEGSRAMNATARSLYIAAVAGLAAQHAFAFTPEQAAAGRAAYEQSCAACHGANMRQLPGSILAGPEFVAKWGERSTSDLLAQASATMPPDRPGALGQDAYLGIVAYILQSNGGAPSAQPLTAAAGARIGAGLDRAVRACGGRRRHRPAAAQPHPRSPPRPRASSSKAR